MNQEIEDLRHMIGVTVPLKVGNRVVEQHPIKIKDWPRFTEVYTVLALESLQEVYRYSDGDALINNCMEITTGKELTEVIDFIKDMTQLDYSEYRKIIIAQNELVFEQEGGEANKSKKE